MNFSSSAMHASTVQTGAGAVRFIINSKERRVHADTQHTHTHIARCTIHFCRGSNHIVWFPFARSFVCLLFHWLCISPLSLSYSLFLLGFATTASSKHVLRRNYQEVCSAATATAVPPAKPRIRKAEHTL